MKLKIEELRLHNFKGFEDRSFDFKEMFTLLVGNNGEGKTAVLDGIAVAIGGFLNGIADLDNNDKKNITKDEIRRKKITLGNTVNLEAQYPVEVECKTEIQGKVYKWIRIKENKGGRTKFDENTDIKKYSRRIQQQVSGGKEIVLPVFAYHGTGRLWAKTNTPAKQSMDSNSRFLGYKNCLKPISNENLFTEWFKTMKRIEIDEGTKSVEFSAVKRAIEEFLGGRNTGIDYNLKEKEIQVTMRDGQLLPYRMLSDGYQNAIGMIADTAFRMVTLNPQLKDTAIIETPGIILIDEIDLHLHPSWQRHIVQDLKRTFPKVQFIATTHAPIVISTCSENEVIKLSGKDEVEYIESTTGWLAEDVLKNIMDVESSREPQTEDMISRMRLLYYKKLEGTMTDDEDKELKDLSNTLEKRLPPSDPTITLTKMDAIEAKILGGDIHA